MSVKSKQITNDNGSKETIILSSEDEREVSLGSNYVLANHNFKKESKLAKKFKGSILGSDIGIKSNGFTSVAILSTVIAVSVLLVLYFAWRF